jgi:hypothetical protein
MNKTSRKRTEITIETRSRTIIRIRNGKWDLRSCRNCGCETLTFTPANAALIFKLDARLIEELLKRSEVHYADENANLCGSSLAGFSETEIRYLED